jgi:hypothetical protein
VRYVRINDGVQLRKAQEGQRSELSMETIGNA